MTGILGDGHMYVYVDYFVPSMHPSRFNATLEMQVPRDFVDLASQADTRELNPQNPDAHVFTIVFSDLISAITLTYKNLDSLYPPQQQNPLPS